MTPSFIVDCSLAMAWCFPDEATPATQELLRRMRDESALVPALWYIEVANVLALAEKKGRIQSDKTTEFTAMLDGFTLEVDDEAPGRAFTHLLALCRTYLLTSYDAIYLELAMRRQLPLATLDEPLRAAAQKAGAKTLGK